LKQEPRDRSHDRALAGELSELAARDAQVRAELAAEGTLFHGYHPRMETVHRDNARRLAAIIEDVGWPSERLVGPTAAEAAWRIAQHAIGEPGFQRRVLALLRAASARGDVPAWQPAMLEDRIRMFEGRPQLYGTQMVADDAGWLRPYAIEDAAGVEDRRRQVGLEPLSAEPRRAEAILSPSERAAHEREYEAWLGRVGWRR